MHVDVSMGVLKWKKVAYSQIDRGIYSEPTGGFKPSKLLKERPSIRLGKTTSLHELLDFLENPIGPMNSVQ